MAAWTQVVTRTAVVFGKTLREVRRDWIMVALTLVFAPAFVLLYYVVFPEMAPAYRVAVVDQDTAEHRTGESITPDRGVVAALGAVRDADGRPLLRVRVEPSRAEALAAVERRDVSAMLVIPPGFSAAVSALAADPVATPAGYTLAGDLTNPSYMVTATLADAAVQDYVRQATGRETPVRPTEEALGASASRTDFEIYTPGLIVFSVIMLIFLAAMTVAREIESGAMRRLRLTRMTEVDYLTGTSGVLALIGISSVALTFATARLCHFHSHGPVWVALLALGLTTLSVIGVGMAVAAVSRSVARAFVIANFPMALMMFFSGSMMPVPRVTWFTVLGHPVGPFESIAPTHAVTALNEILTLGGGFAEVRFELASLLVLTVVYFGCGALLLRRARRRAA